MSLTLPLIALGGAAGFRPALSDGFRHRRAAWARLAVNVIGSFAIGVALRPVWAHREGWQLFLMTGVLGGFTTFSAFSLDTLKLVQAGQPCRPRPMCWARSPFPCLPSRLAWPSPGSLA